MRRGRPQLDILNVIKKRTNTEARLVALVRAHRSAATLEQITTMIFEEDPERASFSTYLDVLVYLTGAPIDDHVLQILEDSWNYFPHRRLGGRCPAEVFGARL